MKRKLFKLFSLCMAVMMLSVPLAAASSFGDTAGHWAEAAIERWAAYDVLRGADGLFRPDEPISRAELAAVLCRIIGYTESGGDFADVAAHEWYYGDIARLYTAGIMQGDGGGIMRPLHSITREEAVVLIARAFNVEENAGNENPFFDAGSISAWASFLVDGMRSGGYISGDLSGNFNPKANITRAEVVTVLSNMIDDFHYLQGEVNDGARSAVPNNAVIRVGGVTLKNYSLAGNLYVMEGVGSAAAALDNVSVTKTTYIRGGSGINVTGGSLGTVVISSHSAPQLKMTAATQVGRIYLNTTASVIHSDVTVKYDAGKNLVTVSGATGRARLGANGTVTVTMGGRAYDIIPPENATFGTVRNVTSSSSGGNGSSAAAVQSVTVTPDSVSTPYGTELTRQLTAAVAVTNGASQAVVWTVHDAGETGENKVSITRGGELFVADDAAPGTAIIRASSTFDASKYGECTVTVLPVYTLTYDVNGGSTAAPNGAQCYQGKDTVTVASDAPVHDTKIFAGWNTDANGRGTFYKAGDSLTVTADVTLYAVWSGDGSAGNPIAVTNQAELAAINTDAASLAKNYFLAADIALVGDWTPIGQSDSPFTGSLYGNAHTVSGLTMNRDVDLGKEGLFGLVTSPGVAAENLCVEIAAAGVTGHYVGGIAGYMTSGTIQNCVVKGGFIYGAWTAGGIVGICNGGTVKNCYAVSDIRTDTQTFGMGCAGGIVGAVNNAFTAVINCYATGAVSGRYAGGIVGRQNTNASVTGCAALNQSVSGSEDAGRIIGPVGMETGANCIAESFFSLIGEGGYNGTLKSAAELKTQAAYTDIGWQFGSDDDSPWVWGLDPLYPLPTLYWQTEAPELPGNFAPEKIAANDEAEKITDLTAGTNGTDFIFFKLEGYENLTAGTVINVTEIKAGADEASAAVIDIGEAISGEGLRVSTKKTVDAPNLTYAQVTFTATLNGVTSGPVTLDISALFGAETTAGKLRTAKGAFKPMPEVLGEFRLVTAELAPNKTVTGEWYSLMPQLTLPAGVTFDAVRGTNQGGMGGMLGTKIFLKCGGDGEVMILFEQLPTADGTCEWKSPSFKCDGTVYTYPEGSNYFMVTISMP